MPATEGLFAGVRRIVTDADQILGFIGVTDVRSVVVQPALADGPDTAQAKLAGAKDELRALARMIAAQ